MHATLKAAAFVATLAAAAPAEARPLSIQIQMKGYSGNPAYLAAYIVDGQGNYVATALTGGYREHYLAHLDRWYRLIIASRRQIDGTTAASVGSGGSLGTTFEVPDSYLNAGYTLRLETAVEGQSYVGNDAAVPLDDAHNGKAVAGRGYAKSLTVSY
jgi:hypothetical protein